MGVSSPISVPIAFMLDRTLGVDKGVTRSEVVLLAEELHDGGRGALTKDELTVVKGCLELTNMTVQDIFTPSHAVFSISDEATYDVALRKKVCSSGYSRIPVYRGSNKDDVYGFVLAKQLLVVEDDCLVQDLIIIQIAYVSNKKTLFELLHQFRQGMAHIALVQQDTGSSFDTEAGTKMLDMPHSQTLGIVTLEQVIEALLQTEIQDETDLLKAGGMIYMDNLAKDKPRKGAGEYGSLEIS